VENKKKIKRPVVFTIHMFLILIMGILLFVGWTISGVVCGAGVAGLTVWSYLK